MSRKQLSFDGFEPANTTPVPDVLFDELLPYLSEAELKVLLYIIRRTSGFKKTNDAISLSQFQNGITKRTGEILDQGCGVKNRTTIANALASLEKKGCIQSEKANDPQGDKATTVYKVRFQSEGVVRNSYHGSTPNVPPVVSETYHGSTQAVPGVVRNSYPQETVIQLDSNTRNSIQESTNIATSAEDRTHAAITDLHEWKTASGKTRAITKEEIASHSQRLSEDDFDTHELEMGVINELIHAGEEDDDVPTVKMPAIPKQMPDAGVPLSLAVNPPVGGQDDAASGQAVSSFSPSVDAAQRTITGANGAVQASIPKRPRAKKAVTQAKSAFVLTEQQQAFWTLWCGVWFNAEITPGLTETAYKHICKLAPYITTQEDMDSLEKYARKRLLEQSGISRREVQLGNCVNCYQTWKQTQQKAQPGTNKLGDYYYFTQEAM